MLDLGTPDNLLDSGFTIFFKTDAYLRFAVAVSSEPRFLDT
jgi:hypothetical protein